MLPVCRSEEHLISTLTALLIVLVAVIGSTTLLGMYAYLLNRIRQIESNPSGDAGSRQLVDQVNEMRDELVTVQREMSALSDRLDFTEKLLMKGDDATSDGSE